MAAISARDFNHYGPPHFGFFEKSAVRVDLGWGEVSSEKNNKISPHTPPEARSPRPKGVADGAVGGRNSIGILNEI